MKIISGVLCALFFLLGMFSVDAIYLRPYTVPGFNDQSYSFISADIQNILFNSNYQATYGNPAITARNLISNPLQPPIWADIGDPDSSSTGNIKLFAATANKINEYNGDGFFLNTSATLESTARKYKIYGYLNETYLIAVDALSRLYVYKIFPNGTFLLWQKHNTTASVENALACYGNDCLLVSANTPNLDGYNDFKGTYFDLSTNGTVSLIGMSVTIGDCGTTIIPKNFDIVSGIFDGGSDPMFSFSEQCAPTTLFGIGTVKIVAGAVTPMAAERVNSVNNEIFSAPIISQVNDLSIDNAIVSFKDLNNHLAIRSYFWNSTKWDIYNTHSFTFHDIDAISNPVSCRIFNTHIIGFDYCAFGFEIANNRTYFLAATDFGVPFGNSNIYTSNAPMPFYPEMAGLESTTHALIAENNFRGGITISDFLTPFGIFKFSPTNQVFGQGDLSLTYPLPGVQHSIIIPFRKSIQTPYYMLVSQTPSSLYFIDDKFIIPGARIDAFTIDPCLNQPIAINTTMQVRITGRSYNDLYPIAARATLYYGDSNEQAYPFSSFFPSGAEISFSFSANKTINNGILRMQVQDINNGSIDTIQRAFTVSQLGVQFGDCQTTETGIISSNTTQTQNNQIYAQNVTNTNNPIKQGLVQTASDTGLPVMLFCLIVILGIDLIIFGVAISNPSMKDHIVTLLIFLAAFDSGAAIVLTFMGIIPLVFILSVGALIVILGALYIGYYINKSHSG